MRSYLLRLFLFALTPFVCVEAEETTPAEIEHVVAVEDVCAWPNLVMLNDGTIVAIFHNRPSHGQGEADVDCWASSDGLTWEKRSTVTAHEPNTVRMNHAAGLAKNGDLIVLCSGWTNIAQPPRPKQAAFRDDILRAWVLRSADGGRTWEKSEEFPATEKGWSEHIPFGRIWAGEDGALHTSTYQGEFADPDKSTKTKGWRSWHLRSDDDGRTWQPVSIIGPTHNETDIFPLGGDRWLAAARTRQMDLIFSEDNGRTWGEPQPVTGRNEINGQLSRLADGRLLLSYGVRVDGRRGVLAKLSSDEGKTWGEPLRLAHTADGGDCGYPSSVQLEDGSIVTAWYSIDSPQHKGYHMGVTKWRAPEVGEAAVGAASSSSNFERKNLVAWCIVPFDAAKRGPEARAKMLAELGLKKCAYDWRQNHVAEFEQEILAYQEHGIEMFAFWGGHDEAYALFEKYDLHPQIWRTMPSPKDASQEEKVAAAVAAMEPLAKQCGELGCQLGLYNHGGWGGEPANLAAVCQALRERGHQQVGIVYNWHHGHHRIAEWADDLALLKPYLLCLNLNGMNDAAEPKILGLGKGKHEAAMLKVVEESGYTGPIGILDHRNELDARESLLENIEGLAKLRTR